MLCLAERSSPEQMKAIREEASTSGAALAKAAEPKEAEIVQDTKESREEHYNPVMWCLPRLFLPLCCGLIACNGPLQCCLVSQLADTDPSGEGSK